MNIDVHFRRRHFEEQQDDRVDRGWNDVAVGLGERVLDKAVANQASVDEDVNRIAVQLLDLGLRHKAVEAHLAGRSTGIPAAFIFFLWLLPPPWWGLREAYALEFLHGGDGDQLVESFFAEDLIDAFAVSRDRRGDQHGAGGRVQFEMFFGMSESVVGDERSDVGELSRLSF